MTCCQHTVAAAEDAMAPLDVVWAACGRPALPALDQNCVVARSCSARVYSPLHVGSACTQIFLLMFVFGVSWLVAFCVLTCLCGCGWTSFCLCALGEAGLLLSAS